MLRFYEDTMKIILSSFADHLVGAQSPGVYYISPPIIGKHNLVWEFQAMPETGGQRPSLLDLSED
jgi:hypothetical protein